MLAFLNILGCFVGSFFLTDATKEIQLQSHSTFRFVNFEEYKFRYLEVPTRTQAPRVWKEIDCAVKCFKTSSCISVNMASAESEDGSFWCELLFEDMFNNSQNFKQNSSSHHITKWVSQLLS